MLCFSALLITDYIVKMKFFIAAIRTGTGFRTGHESQGAEVY